MDQPQADDRAAALLIPEQRAMLDAVLNCLLPPNGTLSGAGDLGVGAAVERSLAVSPALRRLVLDGLVEIELTSARQTGAGFAGLDGEGQDAVLRAVEQARPAFFGALVELAYHGYYTLPGVQEAVGFGSRPPQPGGHQLPAFDPALLEVQRRREPFWRRTG